MTAFDFTPLSITRDRFAAAPADYQHHCIRIMAMTAYAENLGGEGLSSWICKAPDNARRRMVARLAYEELDHGYRMYRLLEDLGVSEDDVAAIANGDGQAGAIHVSLHPAERMYADKGEQWLDLALHCLLMDRAGQLIVSNFADSSYRPWAEAATVILAEETMHIGFGRREFERALERGVAQSLLRERFRYWYSRALNFFGPPAGKTAPLLKAYGIKRRDNDQLRQLFIAQTRDYLESIGQPGLQQSEHTTYPFA